MINQNKNSKEYIIEMAEAIINDIVRPKFNMKEQYEYYYGIRSVKKFQYLEENYGIGKSTSVGFTPLIKNHIDYLVGQYTSESPKLKIVCKDKKTIDGIEDEKQQAIKDQKQKYYMGVYDKMIEAYTKGEKIENTYNIDEVNAIADKTSESFISSFEKAAQYIIETFKQSKNIGFSQKRISLTLDLFISGMNAFRVTKSRSGDNMKYDIFNPMNVFYEKTPDSCYLSDCRRIVIRKWMTKYQIISEYEEHLTQNDINDINEKFSTYDIDMSNYVYSMPGMTYDFTSDDHETIPGFPYNEYHIGDDQLIPVYEIEWLDYDKNDGKDKKIPKDEYKYVTYRYKCVRIGEDLYLPIGKDDVYDRTEDNPADCKLSVGGVFMLDRTDRLFSIVRACMDLQDKYDIICFVRDAVIAQSGTVGSWMDVSQLPTFLGTDMVERVEKWIAYSRNGQKLVDSSQEGQSLNNTVYQQYDETVKSSFLEGIGYAAKQVENDISKITGVYPSILGEGAEYQVQTQRQEIKNVLYITKRYFSTADLAIEESFIDAINIAKVAWPKGRRGTILFNDKIVNFSLLPNSFSATDYDVFLYDSTDSINEAEKMNSLLQSLIQNQSLEMSVLPDLISSKSLSDMSEKMKEGILRKNNYDEKISELNQQLKQATDQLEQLQKKNDDLEKQKDNYNIEKIKAEKQKNDEEMKFKYYEAQQKNEIENKKIEIQKRKEGIK